MSLLSITPISAYFERVFTSGFSLNHIDFMISMQALSTPYNDYNYLFEELALSMNTRIP